MLRNIAEDVGIAGDALVVGAVAVTESGRVSPEEAGEIVSEGVIILSEDLPSVEWTPAA